MGHYARGWRPWPRQEHIPRQGTADTDRAHRGATYARDLLAKRTNPTEETS